MHNAPMTTPMPSTRLTVLAMLFKFIRFEYVAQFTEFHQAKLVTVRNSSCEKVMFSQVYVKNSVHRGLGHTWQVGVCCREACVAGGVHGRRDGHCSGQNASYWNVFLFFVVL